MCAAMQARHALSDYDPDYDPGDEQLDEAEKLLEEMCAPGE